MRSSRAIDAKNIRSYRGVELLRREREDEVEPMCSSLPKRS